MFFIENFQVTVAAQQFLKAALVSSGRDWCETPGPGPYSRRLESRASDPGLSSLQRAPRRPLHPPQTRGLGVSAGLRSWAELRASVYRPQHTISVHFLCSLLRGDARDKPP